MRQHDYTKYTINIQIEANSSNMAEVKAAIERALMNPLSNCHVVKQIEDFVVWRRKNERLEQLNASLKQIVKEAKAHPSRTKPKQIDG